MEPVSENPKAASVRDRRRRRRILTLPNALKFALALVVLFFVVSLISEYRGGAEPGEYGRLYSRRARRVELEERKPFTVVEETNINDQTGADPMLLEAARRQQYLGVTDADIQAMIQRAQPKTDTAPIMIPGTSDPVLQQNSDREKARFEITGGPGGVTVKKE